MKLQIPVVICFVAGVLSAPALAKDFEKEIRSLGTKLNQRKGNLKVVKQKIGKLEMDLAEARPKLKEVDIEFEELWGLIDAEQGLYKPLEQLKKKIKAAEETANGVSWWWRNTEGKRKWAVVDRLKEQYDSRRKQISKNLKANGMQVKGYPRTLLRLTLDELNTFVTERRADAVQRLVPQKRVLDGNITRWEKNLKRMKRDRDVCMTEMSELRSGIAALRAEADRQPVVVRYSGTMSKEWHDLWRYALVQYCKTSGYKLTSSSFTASPMTMEVSTTPEGGKATVKPIHLTLSAGARGDNRGTSTGPRKKGFSGSIRGIVEFSEGAVQANGTITGTLQGRFELSETQEGKPQNIKKDKLNPATWRAVPDDEQRSSYLFYTQSGGKPLYRLSRAP